MQKEARRSVSTIHPFLAKLTVIGQSQDNVYRIINVKSERVKKTFTELLTLNQSAKTTFTELLTLNQSAKTTFTELLTLNQSAKTTFTELLMLNQRVSRQRLPTY